MCVRAGGDERVGGGDGELEGEEGAEGGEAREAEGCAGGCEGGAEEEERGGVGEW